MPRADIERTEKGLRRIESAVRDAEDRKVAPLQPRGRLARPLARHPAGSVGRRWSCLAAAEAKGNAKQVADLTAKLTAQRAWLDQAQGGFGSAADADRPPRGHKMPGGEHPTADARDIVVSADPFPGQGVTQ